MLRGTKSLLAVGALVVVGLALRWVTAGTITAANSHDLDSLTVLAVGAVAWIAYCWLVLAVLATALEQLPGAVGTAAGLVARGITSTTSRALLRSALGVAAVTPLTVGMAQAAPSPAAHSAAAWQPAEHLGANPRAASSHTNFRATESRSSVQIDANRVGPQVSTSGGGMELPADRAGFRATEPRSSVQPGSTGERSGADAARPGQANGPQVSSPRESARLAPNHTNFRATEPRSSIEIDANRGDSRGAGASAQGASHTANFRSTEPHSSVEIDADRTNLRPTEPRSGVQLGATRERSAADAGQTAGPRNGVRTGAGVPTVRPQDRGATTQPQGPTASDGRPHHPSTPQGRGVTGAPRARADGGVKVPDRPEVGAATRYTHLRSGVASRVTVAAGDSLWELAKRELGAEATDEQIAARWPEWYAANRQAIGTDPNLILPGQVLRVPPTSKEQ